MIKNLPVSTYVWHFVSMVSFAIAGFLSIADGDWRRLVWQVLGFGWVAIALLSSIESSEYKRMLTELMDLIDERKRP